MKHWIGLFFILVQVGTALYVNPEYVIAVDRETIDFTECTAIHVMNGDSTRVIKSDWALSDVVKAIQKVAGGTDAR